MNIIIDFNTNDMAQFGESKADTVARILHKIAEDIQQSAVNPGYAELREDFITYGFIKVAQ